MTRFQHLNVPLHWEQYWTKYPEGYTILEALINWVSQVDSMVDNVNNWNIYLDKFVKDFDKELQDTVTDILTEWQDSGFLNIVINEALQTQIDSVEKRVDNATRNVFNVMDAPYNAKGDGVTDDSAAIMQAVADWEAYGLEGGILEIPSGRYAIATPIDLALHFTKSAPYQRKIFNMSLDAELIALTNMQYMINIEATSEFLCSTFHIGSLNMIGYAGDCLRVRNANDSYFKITQCIMANGTGIRVDSSGNPAHGVFNNIWDIQKVGDNSTGMEIVGSDVIHPYGFQGNLLRIAQIFTNTNGLIVDSQGPGNSVLNTFHIGVAEFNGAGIIDKQGSNSYFIGNTNENTNGGFVLPAGAKGIPFIHGVLHDGIFLNGQLGRVVNLGAPVGALPAPAVPPHGVKISNPFTQDVRIFIKGLGLAAVYIGDNLTLQTEGMFILKAGEHIQLSYTEAPEWAWFGM